MIVFDECEIENKDEISSKKEENKKSSRGGWNKGLTKSDHPSILRTSQKLSLVRRGQSSGNKGQKLSEEHKGKISEGRKGKKHSEETKERIRQSRRNFLSKQQVSKQMPRPPREHIESELIKCKQDCIYFIEEYVMIQHPTKGIIQFKLWDFQKDLIKSYLDHRFNIVLKARQLGISTLTASYALWLAMFHRGKGVLCLATKTSVAQNIIAKIELALKRLPVWMKPKLVKSNTTEKEFDNDSFIKAISTTEEAGRSEALSLLIIDESAFIYMMNEVWSASSHTIQHGGDCIVVSTPNGVGNWFHKTFVDSEANLNEFYPITLPWYVCPVYDKEWRKQQDRIDPQKATQECDASFLSSGNNVIDLEFLKKKFYHMKKEPIAKEYDDRNLHVWEFPQSDKIYIISSDTSRGDASDYSTAIVNKLGNEYEKDKVVATYKGKILTDKFGEFLNELGRSYNDAYLIIENASMGIAVIQKVVELGYPNLHCTPRGGSTDFLPNPNVVLPTMADYFQDSVPGFTTSGRTRPAIIGKMVGVFYNEEIEIYDSRVYSEFETFISINGKPQAAPGYNDDLILALCFGLWVRDIFFRSQQMSIAMTKARLNLISHVTQSYSPIYIGGREVPDPYVMNIVGGKQESIRWLFDSK